jgi:hypothetical protein
LSGSPASARDGRTISVARPSHAKMLFIEIRY